MCKVILVIASAKLLVRRWERAKGMNEVASQSFARLSSEAEGQSKFNILALIIMIDTFVCEQYLSLSSSSSSG